MRGLRRGATAVAAVGLMMTAAPAIGTGTASAERGGDGRVPLSALLRDCAHDVRSHFASFGTGTGYVLMNAGGGTVTADVTMATAERNMPYQVKLIQAPRSRAATCNPGDPGVVGGVLHTDAAGGGHLTLTADLMPDATGAWVEVSRPNPHSLRPVEYYTSDIISRF